MGAERGGPKVSGKKRNFSGEKSSERPAFKGKKFDKGDRKDFKKGGDKFNKGGAADKGVGFKRREAKA
jgi:hypothetical protein